MIDRLFNQNTELWKNLAALILRVQTGAMMLTHGLPKLLNFADRMDKFPDPLGVGSTTSLGLVVFAEVFCSILLLLGIKVRWAVIPLMITMLVAVFVMHGDDPFKRKELGLMYLGCYLVLLLLGGGKFGLGTLLKKR